MSTAEIKTRLDPEDLLAMPDGDQYELVDGQLVERPMSFWSSYVAGSLFLFMGVHCRAARAGWAAPEGTSYQCFPHAPKQVRRADASFIRLDRLELARATQEGHLSIAPDLAAEVVSPHDEVYKLDQKVLDFLQAGTQLVWVVNPLTRKVRVHRPDGTISQLGEQDELTGEDVLPGFHVRVADLFLPPAGPDR